MKIWFCKIGECHAIPRGADFPMREAVSAAYRQITGQDADFIFSGWGGELTEAERAVVEDRLPIVPAGMADPAAEIEKLREDLAEAVEALEDLLIAGDFRWGCEDVKTARATLAKIKGE